MKNQLAQINADVIRNAEQRDTAQHSPLPWEKIYTLGENSGEGGRRHIHIISGDKPVATLRSGFVDDEANAAYIVQAVNAYPHAERLAEALREIAKEIEERKTYKPDRIFKGCELIVRENAKIAREALAAWEGAQ